MAKAVTVLRWTGRIWSLASLAFLISFALGNRATPTGSEVVGLVLFPGGVAAGLVIGWWREGAGGATAVMSLAAFYAWSLLFHGGVPHGPWFLLVAAPGPIFVICALLQEIHGAPPDPRSPGT